MAKKIKELISALRKEKTTSVDLERALEVARGEAADIKSEIEAASSAYDAGLLDLDAAQLQEMMVRRQTVEVERDRVQRLVVSLAARLDEVRAAEEAAAFEVERSAVDAEAERVAQIIRTRYPKLATELVDMMRQITKADHQVDVMNRRLIERGAKPLADVQTRGLPQPASPHATAPSIWGVTTLPSIEGFAPGWEVTPGGQIVTWGQEA